MSPFCSVLLICSLSTCEMRGHGSPSPSVSTKGDCGDPGTYGIHHHEAGIKIISSETCFDCKLHLKLEQSFIK